jgi:hypothetical protein
MGASMAGLCRSKICNIVHIAGLNKAWRDISCDIPHYKGVLMPCSDSDGAAA